MDNKTAAQTEAERSTAYWLAYGEKMYESGIAIGRAQMLNEIAGQDIARIKESQARAAAARAA